MGLYVHGPINLAKRRRRDRGRLSLSAKRRQAEPIPHGTPPRVLTGLQRAPPTPPDLLTTLPAELIYLTVLVHMQGYEVANVVVNRRMRQLLSLQGVGLLPAPEDATPRGTLRRMVDRFVCRLDCRLLGEQVQLVQRYVSEGPRVQASFVEFVNEQDGEQDHRNALVQTTSRLHWRHAVDVHLLSLNGVKVNASDGSPCRHNYRAVDHALRLLGLCLFFASQDEVAVECHRREQVASLLARFFHGIDSQPPPPASANPTVTDTATADAAAAAAEATFYRHPNANIESPAAAAIPAPLPTLALPRVFSRIVFAGEKDASSRISFMSHLLTSTNLRIESLDDTLASLVEANAATLDSLVLQCVLEIVKAHNTSMSNTADMRHPVQRTLVACIETGLMGTFERVVHHHLNRDLLAQPYLWVACIDAAAERPVRVHAINILVQHGGTPPLQAMLFMHS